MSSLSPDTSTAAASRKPALKRNASMLDVVMLGAGAAMGPSIFSVLGPAASIAGAGALSSIVLAIVPMAVLGFLYSFLASAAPRSGASYEWPREFIHPVFAFLISWMRIIGSVGVLVTTALVFVQYAGTPFGMPPKLIMFAIFLAVYVLNVIGISAVAKMQTLFMLILLGVMAIYVVCGVPHASFSQVDPIPASLVTLFLPLPLLINMFVGIETATEIGEEVVRPERTIPIGIGAALLLTLFVYLCVAWTTFALLGADGVARSSAPLIDASRQTGIAILPTIVAVGAGLALIKSVNVLFMIFVRFVFAMARSGALPSVLGRVHPTRGTPYVAATAAFVCTCLGLLMPSNLTFLLIAAGIPTLLKYGSTSICAFRLPDRFPQVFQASAIRISALTLKVLGILGAAFALGIVALSTETDWRPLALTSAWLVLGLVYLRARSMYLKRNGDASAATMS